MSQSIDSAQTGATGVSLATTDAERTSRPIFCYIEAGATLCLLMYAIVSLVALKG